MKDKDEEDDGEPVSNNRKTSRKAAATRNKSNKRWIIKIIFLSVFISIVFTFASSQILGNAGYLLAFVVLAIFVFLGVIFDIIGIAVAVAEEKPFHSMASHKERGAAEALRLIKNADKVSSFCNDVMGDISGIVSGTTAAVIVAKLVSNFSMNSLVIQLVISALVAGLTIGGKAMGKVIALGNSTKIVLSVGKLVSILVK